MRIRLTLLPGRRGTKKLLDRYGKQLVCVRYRYDTERKKRLKTVELIIDEVDWEPKKKPVSQDSSAKRVSGTEAMPASSATPPRRHSARQATPPPQIPSATSHHSRTGEQQRAMTTPAHQTARPATTQTSSTPGAAMGRISPQEHRAATPPPSSTRARSTRWPAVPIQGLRPKSLVGVRVAYGEYGLDYRLRQTGGTWDDQRRLWITTYGKVIIMDLLDRMVRLDE